MKFFAIILSVVVLALAVTPCCASDNCRDDCQTEQANGKSNDCETPCSPFVSCTSCPGAYITPSIEMEAVLETEIKKTFVLYNPAFISFYTANIWQPPKIAC